MKIVHHMSVEQIAQLEEAFAFLTPEGWKVPCWVKELYNWVQR